jgi:hypothetical protein
MDILGHILLSLAGGAAAQAGHGLYGWLRQNLNDLFKDHSETKIVEVLESIGNLADGDIRKRVDELSRLKKRWRNNGIRPMDVTRY